ncbi:unnamed protein product [Gadus morhua 'NCC']
MSCVATGNHPTKDHFRVRVEHISHQHSWRPCTSCPARGNSTTNQSLSEAGPSQQGSGPITEDHMKSIHLSSNSSISSWQPSTPESGQRTARDPDRLPLGLKDSQRPRSPPSGSEGQPETPIASLWSTGPRPHGPVEGDEDEPTGVRPKHQGDIRTPPSPS